MVVKSNLFDENFFLYYEDIDLCLRCWKSGSTVLLNTDVEVIHDARRTVIKNFFSLFTFTLLSVTSLFCIIYVFPKKVNLLLNFNNIDLLSFNCNKTIIVVQGLGFVGSVMSIVCANSDSKEYAVIGVDLNTENSKKRISDFNNGTFPLTAEDPKIDIYFKNTINQRNFYATTDTNAYSYADIIIVDINLDVQNIITCTIL